MTYYSSNFEDLGVFNFDDLGFFNFGDLGVITWVSSKS